ncbi:hypothetical protein QTG54_014952 [Skeletonema marinoi]|uniref:Uncharacterized protein n=1 Tax=Skeletonema marinoi TaxID=267567 RepID=A0AAD9D689_9STRA|nr:hypothetical protein QTG54_014952 [Skeletonema marinoi]
MSLEYGNIKTTSVL